MPWEEHRTQTSGFTLIEIMVALIVIGIIAALVVPRTAVMNTVELKAAARNLAGTIHLVYNTAVMEKKYYRIVFDLEGQSYWVEEQDGKRFVRSSNELLGERLLADNIYFKRVTVMDRDCGEWCQVSLYFTPGGYVEEASIYLGIVDDNPVISVFTRPMTGTAALVMGEVTRAEWEEE
jgi:type II secretion system protein H